MYGLTELLLFPNSQTPELQRMELFSSFEDAKKYADALMQVFFAEYGEDYGKPATGKNPVAQATNGETDWFAYISEVDLKNEERTIEIALNILKYETMRAEDLYRKNNSFKIYEYVDKEKLAIWSQLPPEKIDEIIDYYHYLNLYKGIKEILAKLEKSKQYDSKKDEMYLATLFYEKNNLCRQRYFHDYCESMKSRGYAEIHEDDIKIVLKEYYGFLVEKIEQMLQKEY